jgi:restriction system protein
VNLPDQENRTVVAANSVPTFDDLLWPTLQALKAMGGSASNDELLAKVIELEHIPEPVAAFIHS